MRGFFRAFGIRSGCHGQTADTPVATKKTKDTEHAKAPVKNSDPYKKDPSEAEQMEARYQELLKKYKIIE